MNIDKLIHKYNDTAPIFSFGSLMNIDKLIPLDLSGVATQGFGSLMNIDKLIHYYGQQSLQGVLAL